MVEVFEVATSTSIVSRSYDCHCCNYSIVIKILGIIIDIVLGTSIERIRSERKDCIEEITGTGEDLFETNGGVEEDGAVTAVTADADEAEPAADRGRFDEIHGKGLKKTWRRRLTCQDIH